MDKYLTLVNEIATGESGIPLQNLQDSEQTAHADNEENTNRSRINIDEDTKIKLVEDVIGLLASLQPGPRSSGPQPKDDSGAQASTEKPKPNGKDSGTKTQTSNVFVPLKEGYKLDLRDIPADMLSKNMKVKFDTDDLNVKVKNVMKEVAKYGDKTHQSRTATKGVLTISILLQNVAQLKSVIKQGESGTENFWFLVILIPISLLIQIVGGVMILYLGKMDTETNEQIKSSYSVTKWILYVSSAASLLNTVIASLLLAQ